MRNTMARAQKHDYKRGAADLILKKKNMIKQYKEIMDIF